MHVLGVEAAVVGVASVATASAAHTSTSQQAPATARVVIVPRGRDENSPARRSAIRPRFFAPLTVRRPLTITIVLASDPVAEWFGCGHITERRRSRGLRIERRKLAKRAAGRRAGERGRPPRTRVRGGDAGERNLGLTAKIEFADIVAIVPILRRSCAEHLLRFSTGWKPGRLPLNLVRLLLPLTSHSRRAPRHLEDRHETISRDAGCWYRPRP
jgi:hypothetical protein